MGRWARQPCSSRYTGDPAGQEQQRVDLWPDLDEFSAFAFLAASVIPLVWKQSGTKDSLKTLQTFWFGWRLPPLVSETNITSSYLKLGRASFVRLWPLSASKKECSY